LSTVAGDPAINKTAHTRGAGSTTHLATTGEFAGFPQAGLELVELALEVAPVRDGRTEVLPYISGSPSVRERARCPPYAGRYRGASEAGLELVELAFEVALADGEGNSLQDESRSYPGVSAGCHSEQAVVSLHKRRTRED